MDKSTLDKYSKSLNTYLTNGEIKRVFNRLERIALKIAPLSVRTGNTHTVFRWELDRNSLHYASKEECEAIFKTLLEDLLGILGSKGHKTRKVLDIFAGTEFTEKSIKEVLNESSRIGSLELPIGYETDIRDGGKHISNNIYWFKPFNELSKLRMLIENKQLITKIQLKAYLTDRRQTGEYQTNREFRWETYPNSPQYASKPECMLIEAKLIAQIFIFDKAPNLDRTKRELVENVLNKKFEVNSFRCPISGVPIKYIDFYEKVTNPTHGRSGFQVGHMVPLANGGRHIAANTSWITELGNRVQGEDSLDTATKNIFYMAQFHREQKKLSWEEVEEITRQMHW
jgi:hypothetical protein